MYTYTYKDINIYIKSKFQEDAYITIYNLKLKSEIISKCQHKNKHLLS